MLVWCWKPVQTSGGIETLVISAYISGERFFTEGIVMRIRSKVVLSVGVAAECWSLWRLYESCQYYKSLGFGQPYNYYVTAWYAGGGIGGFRGQPITTKVLHPAIISINEFVNEIPA